MKQIVFVVVLFLLGILGMEIASVSTLWTVLVLAVFIVTLVVYPYFVRPKRLDDATSLATNFVFATTSVCSVCVMQDINVLNLIMFVYALADTATWVCQQMRKGFVQDMERRTPTKTFVGQIALFYILFAMMLYLCFTGISHPWSIAMAVFIIVEVAILSFITFSPMKFNGETHKELGIGIKDIIALAIIYVGDKYIFGCDFYTTMPLYALVCLLLILANGLLSAQMERKSKSSGN